MKMMMILSKTDHSPHHSQMASVARHFLVHVQLSLFSRCHMAFFQSTTDGNILVASRFLFMLVVRTRRQRQSLTCTYTDTIFSHSAEGNEEEIHGENQSRISFFKLNALLQIWWRMSGRDSIVSSCLSSPRMFTTKDLWKWESLQSRSRTTCLMHFYAWVERHSADIGLIWSVTTSRWMAREREREKSESTRRLRTNDLIKFSIYSIQSIVADEEKKVIKSIHTWKSSIDFYEKKNNKSKYLLNVSIIFSNSQWSNCQLERRHF